MQGAESSGHKFFVAAILVKFQEGRLQFHKDLASFLLEGLLVFVDRLRQLRSINQLTND